MLSGYMTEYHFQTRIVMKEFKLLGSLSTSPGEHKTKKWQITGGGNVDLLITMKGEELPFDQEYHLLELI